MAVTRFPGPQEVDPSAAPTLHPETYPGEVPDFSFLLYERRVARIAVTPGRRLPQARALGLTSELVGTSDERNQLPLSYVLLRLNAAPMDRRTPVIAVGSNGSPSQLSFKFQNHGASGVVPAVRADVANLAIAFSAHINDRGYLPVAPTRADTVLHDTHILFLDRQQLLALDRTEPNYQRVLLRSEDGTILLEGGEEIGEAFLYRSRHGLIAPDAAGPLGPFESPPAITKQEEAVDELLSIGGLSGSLRAHTYAEFRERAESFKNEFRNHLGDAGLLRSDLITATDSPPSTYGEIRCRLPDTDTSGDFRVVATPEVLDRRGVPVVRMPASVRKRMGSPRSVTIARQIDQGGLIGSDEIRLVAAVQTAPDGDVPDGYVQADQVLRNALGVELHEKMSVVPTRTPRHRPSVVAGPQYIVARVQIAEIKIVEQQACLLPQTALRLLGIESGDVVIVEGAVLMTGGSTSDYRLSRMRLKAIEASEELLEQRGLVAGGGLDARYPSARDTLGVYPDLAWVFMDAGTRSQLGSGRLGAVRIRASRSYQLAKEIRELMLLLLVAAVGASTQIASGWIAGILLTIITIASVVFVLIRLRARLTRPRTTVVIGRPFSRTGDSSRSRTASPPT